MALKRRNTNVEKPSMRATNIEMFSRDISISKDDKKIYSRDSDNLYPLRIEKAINNSPTGRRCANLMAKFIAGNGVDGNTVVNKSGETINDLIDKASNDIANQYGVYFHISYKFNENGDVVKSGVHVLDYVSMAKSKEDDDGFPGKFYKLSQIEGKSLFNKSEDKSQWYYAFSDIPEVVLSQMRNDCKLKGIKEPKIADLVTNHRGQVLYLNLTPKYVYALSLADSVYDDLDTEYRISRYNNTNVRSGWLGKTVVKKFDDDADENTDFNDILKDNLGAENASNVLVVSVPMGATDDVDKVFKVDQLKAQFDDKLFESTVRNLRINILGAFNNIPEPLIFSGQGSLFGTSADTYREMKKFYWEQNEYERFKLEKTLEKILDRKINILSIVKEDGLQ